MSLNINKNLRLLENPFQINGFLYTIYSNNILGKKKTWNEDHQFGYMHSSFAINNYVYKYLTKYVTSNIFIINCILVLVFRAIITF